MFCGVPIRGKELKKYQAKHLCANDYYEKGKAVKGVWRGEHLDKFGLTEGAFVDSAAFAEMADGRMGDLSGVSWVLRRDKNRRSFYDFTISAPKSFSVACIVGGDERIRRWHKEAVDAAMKAIEAGIRRRVRIKGAAKDEVKVTGNFVVAQYHHDASRKLDPQLHDHLCVFNGTYDEDDGKIYAVDYGAIMERSRLYTEIYRHVLAGKALGGGYDIVVGEDGAPEIKGVLETNRRMSARSEMIDAVAALYRDTCGGELSRRQLKSVSLISRGLDMDRFSKAWALAGVQLAGMPKNKSFARLAELLRDCGGNAPIVETTTAEVRRRQKGRLGEEGVNRVENAVSAALRKARSREHGEELREGGCANAGEALAQAIRSIFETKSVAMDYEIMEKALLLAPLSEESHTTIRVLLDSAHRSEIVLKTRSGGLTTAETLRSEGDLLECALRWKGAFKAAGEYVVRPDLSEEQRKVVRGILESTDGVVAVLGDAGTGKTFATEELVRALTAKGAVVQTMAPTCGARDVLRKNGERLLQDGDGDAARAFLGAMTLQKALANFESVGSSGIPRGAYIILDEAGLVSVKMMTRLFRLCENEGHRLAMIGDFKQHAPVEAGGAFRLLTQSGVVESLRLSEIRRQHADSMGGAYRIAARLMASGNVEAAFKTLDNAGAIVEAQGRERYEAMAQAYVDSTKRKRSCLCVNYTHRENDMLSDCIRMKLKDAGLLAEGRKVEVFKPLNIGNADKVAANMRPGMWLVERPGLPGERAWQVLRAKDTGELIASDGALERVFRSDALRLAAVCERREIEISTGDVLMLRANIKTESEELPNGGAVKVAGLTEAGYPIDEKGHVVKTRMLSYGYAMTSHKSQGATCDDVVIGFDMRAASVADVKMAYVASTRGRGTIKIFCESKEDLDLLARRSGDAPLAIEDFFNIELSDLMLENKASSLAEKPAPDGSFVFDPTTLHAKIEDLQSLTREADAAKRAIKTR